jgi:acetylornithine deacetylase
MDPVALTRQLIDIESISGNEGAAGEFLAQQLEGLGYAVERMPVEEGRFNVYARPAGVEAPPLVFSTHLDTVPPFILSREDDANIYGRGACDAKGILAAMVAASLRLNAAKVPVGLLFVVGEERNSKGALTANEHPRGSRFLVNGEPTDNRMASLSKGCLRVEVVCHGRPAHSAYPELGESAIEKLLDVLQRLRTMELPHDETAGATTLNIGIIEGGKATNVIPDFAKAQLLYRLVGESAPLREKIVAAAADEARIDFVLDIAYMNFRTVPGIETMTAAFTTDIPKLSNWGEPVLLGPGSILVAHTEREFIAKAELFRAVDLYEQVARHLLA